ncbi:MAG: xanthine dehydrogenase family protein subunit M [Alphaproteobacteria bacterium]|nr:xanthine dehydrogenase family protein subunit M [Alphaproteobacteria bacterium]
MPLYLRPGSLDEALGALAAGSLTVVSGGTDFYPARVGRPLDDDVMDISRLAGLRGISETASGWRIGALATWTDVIERPLPALFDALKQAAREVGGMQIQNRGTVAGNLCNASPAADGVPPLMAMDATVELASASGTRALRLDAFITGNRRTVRRTDEIVTAILVPKPAAAASSAFLKLGARRYLVISIAMVAAVAERAHDGTAAAVRVAVGSCSEVARRLPALEAALVGRDMTRLGETVAPGHLAPLSPIDDVRGSGAYRRDAALTLVRRALDALGRAA